MSTLYILLSAASFLFPDIAWGQTALETIEAVGSPLPFLAPSGACVGNAGCGFVDIAMGIVIRYRPILSAVAILNMVIFGYRMIIGQEDDVLTKARAVMSGTIAGLIMLWLIDPFILAFYGTSGEVPQNAIPQGVAFLTVEVLGIINWALAIVAALAVLILILSAVKAIGQSASEEGMANLRKSVFTVVFGLILLAFRFLLSDGFVATTGNPIPVLAEALTMVSYIMGFLALAALIVVVFAGFQYVLSLGKEEQATKAKDLLIRVAIGAVVIVVSLALVNFVIIPGVQ
ncbi:MAG: hypothetical protein HOO67_04210 [Candidatus Peribacteraceae bacterium]|nr:hypothetical protein [Candidatus Peribacteraceae bacterium]